MGASENLPPELEREIFELCAAGDFSSAKSLILVAKRVHTWIEPVLYRVLFYYQHERPGCAPSTSLLLEYVKKGVVTPRLRAVCAYAHRILLQGMTSDMVTNILKLCTNVQEVDIWLMEGDYLPLQELIPVIGAPVSRLSIHTGLLFATSDSRIRVDAAVLRHITHLDVISVYEDAWMEEWRTLGLLPKLSHLAFSMNGRVRVHIVESILNDTVGFRTLRILVLFGTLSRDAPVNSRVVNDKRLIELSTQNNPIEDWIRGARTGYDFWDRAERIQKGKESPPSPHSDSSELDLDFMEGP